MSYTIILETDCVLCDSMQDVMDVCPVEAIKPGAPYPFINEDCVNCSACVDACPHGAIAENLDRKPKEANS